MKIQEKKLKRGRGIVKLVPESLDDLWHLKYIIERGDLVTAFTKRRVEGATDKIRPESSEKKAVHLTIEVEETEFHRFSNRLRVRGIIRKGIDTGEYHTINIEIKSAIKITKDWKHDQLERLDDAATASARPRVTIVTIESGEACIGLVRQFGVEMVTQITQPAGKRGGDFTNELYSSLASALEQTPGQGEQHAIIVAGPGFIKEDFMDHLRAVKPDIASRAVLEDTVSTGMPGFIEVLRRGAVDRIVQESRIGREAELLDSLMVEIAKDGVCAYGWAEVMSALELGAIDVLLIVDETLRNFREEGAEYDADLLLRKVEQMQGRVVVFSSEFEPGQRLGALGGVAALLRFRMA